MKLPGYCLGWCHFGTESVRIQEDTSSYIWMKIVLCCTYLLLDNNFSTMMNQACKVIMLFRVKYSNKVHWNRSTWPIRINHILWYLHNRTYKYISMNFILKIIENINVYQAEILKWNNPPSIFGTFHNHFSNIKMRTCSWSSNNIEYGQTARIVAKIYHFRFK